MPLVAVTGAWDPKHHNGAIVSTLQANISPSGFTQAYRTNRGLTSAPVGRVVSRPPRRPVQPDPGRRARTPGVAFDPLSILEWGAPREDAGLCWNRGRRRSRRARRPSASRRRTRRAESRCRSISSMGRCMVAAQQLGPMGGASSGGPGHGAHPGSPRRPGVGRGRYRRSRRSRAQDDRTGDRPHFAEVIGELRKEAVVIGRSFSGLF